MNRLFVRKYIDQYIRSDLNMGIRTDIYDKLDEKIKSLLLDAKERSIMDGRKTIMAKDL